MAETTIEWAKYTFNPWRGCTKIAPGCENCYAATEAKRFPANRGTWGLKGTRVVAAEAQWRKPLKWNRDAEKEQKDYSDYAHRVAGDRTIPLGDAPGRPRVFCASLADVFEDWDGPLVDVEGRELWVHDCEPKPEPFRYVPMPKGGPAELLPCERENLDAGMYRRLTMADVRKRLFSLIDATPNLDWMLLTKRPENIKRMWLTRLGEQAEAASIWSHRSNVWLGASVSTQADVAPNAAALSAIHDLSPVRFLSAEPLLEPLDLGRLVHRKPFYSSPEFQREMLGRMAIDLVIVGGESGPGARPCELEWIRSIVEQCRTAGVACFVKQLGAAPYDGVPGYQIPLRGGVVDHVKHKKGGDPAEWPEDLRVREMPKGASR